MRDFTLEIYRRLLESLLAQGYVFMTLKEYFSSEDKPNKIVLMRHDVDRRPANALEMAKVEREFNVKATYYFRTVPATFKPEIIYAIASMYHEIAYHYESLAECNGDFKEAIKDFEFNLNRLREFYPVKSIAMHGRPLSKYDSRMLWQIYDYKKYGILSEPYFDIDFSKVLYVTDAGRSWDNEKINLRDRVDRKYKFNFNPNIALEGTSDALVPMTNADRVLANAKFGFKHTQEIINAINSNRLPNEIMFNIHPEHWAGTALQWYRIYIERKGRNFVKRLLIS